LGIANESGVILTSATGKVFAGVIIGNSTLDGVVASYAEQQTNLNIYFNSSNTNYFEATNWYLDNLFTTPSTFIPNSNSLVNMSGNSAVVVNIDNPLWQTPKVINTLNIANTSGIVLTSTTGKRFTGTIIGNSTFSGAIPFYNPEEQDINIYFNSSDNDYYNVNNWYLDTSYTTPSTFIPNLRSLVTMSVNSIVMVNIDNPLWVTPKIINTLNVANTSGIILTSTTGKRFTGTIIGKSAFSGVIVSYS
jgi:mRNA-degrading endonuclease HigB of HigAB toxin-antitoxin module